MAKHATVERFESFDVHVLHRMGALQETLVSHPWVTFRWPGLVRLTANRWRVDVEFRGGAVQRIPLMWTRCHFGGLRPWFRCFRCNCRVGKLYNTEASLQCRRCLDLWYASQRRGEKSRRYTLLAKRRLVRRVFLPRLFLGAPALMSASPASQPFAVHRSIHQA
jgi:hypothetical protein